MNPDVVNPDDDATAAADGPEAPTGESSVDLATSPDTDLVSAPDAAAAAARKRAAIVLGAIVAVLAVFFFFVAMAPKGKPADGTLPVDPVGYMVPDLTLPKLNTSGDLSLRSLVGKPVVINFWASWCVTCKDEAAIMGEAERKYRAQGVVFIGIDESDKNDEAKAFERQYGMDYESVVDPEGKVGPNWGVTGYPETFFVGKDGRIVSKYISNIDAATLDQRIQELLAP